MNDLVNDSICVTEAPLSMDAALAWLNQDLTGVGAHVTFTGLVRELPDAQLEGMELEHYPGMTEKALEQIIVDARARWPLKRVWIAHRVGLMHLGDQVVQVAVSSAHRAAAFEAAMFMMDYLKRDAPFWKKEISDQGSVWVEQKGSDLDAANRWDR